MSDPMLDYRGNLRLDWSPEAGISAERVGELEPTNLAVLQSVAAMEEGVSPRLREEQPELHHELERLGARLDLLLDMVARLLKHADELTARPAVMAVERLRFLADPGEVEAEQTGLLRLFLHPAVPQPLVLPGRILAVADEGPEAGWAEFQPLPISTRLRDALGQHVFRHHRRMIAEQRARG